MISRLIHQLQPVGWSSIVAEYSRPTSNDFRIFVRLFTSYKWCITGVIVAQLWSSHWTNRMVNCGCFWWLANLFMSSSLVRLAEEPANTKLNVSAFVKLHGINGPLGIQTSWAIGENRLILPIQKTEQYLFSPSLMLQSESQLKSTLISPIINTVNVYIRLQWNLIMNVDHVHSIFLEIIVFFKYVSSLPQGSLGYTGDISPNLAAPPWGPTSLTMGALHCDYLRHLRHHRLSLKPHWFKKMVCID